jgi:ketosteroid isomerase-like protein
VLEDSQSFLGTAFAKLFDPLATEVDLLEFFSPDYVQDLNGREHSFREFLDGVSTLKATLRSSTITVTRAVASGDQIAEIHVVDATKNDGTRLRFKVIEFQTIDHGRIKRTEEVNCPLQDGRQGA